MPDTDKNELIQSLMRLRKRCCGGVSAACMTTNARMVKDNAEFQKIIRDVKSLIDERDEARRLYCEEAFTHRFNERGGLGPITDPKQIAQGMKWDCFKEDTDV